MSEEIRIILLVLEKAEQILSLVNLPESTIRKYNELKQLSCKKLNIDYFPLEKSNLSNSFSAVNSSGSRYLNKSPESNNRDYLVKYITLLRELNSKKNVVVDFLGNLMENFIISSNVNNTNSIEYSTNMLVKQLESSSCNFLNVNTDDLEFDYKLEEIKLKEQIGKAETNAKRLGLMMKEEQINKGNVGILMNKEVENLAFDYEKKIEEIKISHECEIARYKERFEQLRYQYKPELESEYSKLQGSLEECRYIISKMNEIVEPVYKRFYSRNLVYNDSFKYKELEMLSYLNNLLFKFYNDNKYLVEVVSQQENTKKDTTEQMSLPFVSNAINKNKLLLDIREDLHKVENSSKESFQKMTDLMQFINTNFTEINEVEN